MTQMDMPLTGEARRDRGIERAANHADRISDGWSDRALEMLRCYLLLVGGKFQAEDIREWSHKRGLSFPPSKRAWGGVVVRARNLGLIRCIGTEKVDNPTAHCANAAIWETI